MIRIVPGYDGAWRLWFAWYPVTTIWDGAFTLIWLEWVEWRYEARKDLSIETVYRVHSVTDHAK
jgi:hypothetical protein